MRKLTYYIAVTLDGYIAGPGGEVDFLPFEGDARDGILAEYPETMPTPARTAFGLTDTPHLHFDTVVMGRATYEPGLAAGLTDPYAHLTTYVVSTTLDPVDPAVNVVRDNPVDLVRKLKSQPGQDIWLCGGGRLAAALLPEIDELILKRNPVAIGSGIPLFANAPFAPLPFTPTATRTFTTGLSITTYARTTSAPAS
ncbi:dihydrofolate reductase family protein [Streptomyces sp. NPDC051940]|uniref:dihydrofolate reductase family protein n=1 Tax=Streptomyces sp. NPDC051940 TaxID=3155675 RepID=UPI0034394F41